MSHVIQALLRNKEVEGFPEEVLKVLDCPFAGGSE